jgi:hypothetical protein
VLTTARHISLQLQTTLSHPKGWALRVVLSFGLHQQTPYAFHLSSIRATCPANLTVLDLITREQVLLPPCSRRQTVLSLLSGVLSGIYMKMNIPVGSEM